MNYTSIKQQIENNTQKLSKTLEKFNLPGYVLPVCYYYMLLASYIVDYRLFNNKGNAGRRFSYSQ